MDEIGPLRSLRTEDDQYVFAFQTDDRHGNAVGLVHGGVIATLLDQTIATVAWHAADRAPTVTVQLETRYVAAVRPGALLQARARLRHRAGSMMFLDAEVTDETSVIALATAIMKASRKDAE